MATIQIREIPEPAYEVLRRRARARGQSIQAFMRDEVITLAGRPSKVASIEAVLGRHTADRPPEAEAEAIVADLAADGR